MMSIDGINIYSEPKVKKPKHKETSSIQTTEAEDKNEAQIPLSKTAEGLRNDIVKEEDGKFEVKSRNSIFDAIAAIADTKDRDGYVTQHELHDAANQFIKDNKDLLKKKGLTENEILNLTPEKLLSSGLMLSPGDEINLPQDKKVEDEKESGKPEEGSEGQPEGAQGSGNTEEAQGVDKSKEQSPDDKLDQAKQLIAQAKELAQKDPEKARSLAEQAIGILTSLLQEKLNETLSKDNKKVPDNVTKALKDIKKGGAIDTIKDFVSKEIQDPAVQQEINALTGLIQEAKAIVSNAWENGERFSFLSRDGKKMDAGTFMAARNLQFFGSLGPQESGGNESAA